MSDYSNLVQRLRGLSCSGAEAMPEFERLNQFVRAGNKAADAIEAQAKQIEKLDDTRIEYIGMINKLVDEREELRKALKPFAMYYSSDCTDLDPDYCVICEADEEENNLTVGLFRAAHKVLERK